VCQQQNPSTPSASEAADHRLSGARGCVLEAHHAGKRFNELNITSQGSKTSGDAIGDPIQSVDIGTARLDGHQLLEGVEVGLLFASYVREHRACRLREQTGAGK
jgi:hypothetical protein